MNISNNSAQLLNYPNAGRIEAGLIGLSAGLDRAFLAAAFLGNETAEAEDPRDQAIDAFMVERAQLLDENSSLRFTLSNARAENARLRSDAARVHAALDVEIADNETLRTEVRRVSDKVARQRGALNGRNRQIADQDATLLQAATFVAQARELLGRIGITVETEDDGRPSLSIDLDVLAHNPIFD